MNKKEIFISTTTFGQYSKEPIEILEKAGYKVSINPTGKKMTSGDVVKYAKNALGLLAGTEKLSADVLKELSDLKVISRCGVGMDNVDLDAAERLNIKVVNTPDGPTLSVAELTVGLILQLLRMTALMDRELKQGNWKKRMGWLLYEKKIGVIGFGRIGKKTAELLKNFGCEIAYCDPFVKDTDYRKMEQDEIIEWADVLTFHVSSKEQIIGKKEIKKMKKGSWLVNVSRGGIIDEQALLESIKSEYLSGAALDVFGNEPYSGPLKDIEHVILTPHIGSYAREARIKMEKDSALNLLNCL